MRALVLTEFGRLDVEERPDPTPGPDDEVITMAAVGICGTDVHGFTGENGRRVPGQIMGHEASGWLADGTPVTFNPMLSCGVCDACRADRPMACAQRAVIGVEPSIPAAFAEQMVLPRTNVVRLPASAPIENGALIEPLAVAVHAVRRAGVQSGQRLLVLGGGPIGQSVVLAAQTIGDVEILLSEPIASRREVCTRLGATALEPSEEPLAERLTASGGLADVTIDAVGITPTINDALAATRPGGTVGLVGMGRPRLEIDAFAVTTAERSIVGSFTYSRRDFADAAAWASDHPDLVSGLISQQVPLDEANAAFTALAGKDPAPGKIIVRISEQP